MRLAARLMTALLVATLVLPALAVGPAFAAAATHLSVTVSASSGSAGDLFDVTVEALDGGDTTDTGYTGTVHFTSTDTNGATNLPNDYTFVGGDNGTHVFSNGAKLTTAGNQTITADDGSINGTSTAVDITAAAASKIVLSGATTTLASGVGRTFTATIEDQFDNVVTTDNSTIVSFDKTAGTGSVTGEGTDTAAAGIATKTVTGQLVGSITITATASGLPDSNVRTFTVVPGAASQIDLTGSTGTLASGSTRLLTATIEDAAGNVETGDNSTVVTFSKTTGAGTVTGLGTDTAAAGVASLTVTGAVLGSITLHATGASLTSNTLTFTVVVGAATQIVLSGSTGTLASGSTRLLTATIEDAGGNVVTGDNSTVVSFDQTTGAGTVTGLGTDTAAAGVASVTVTGALVGSVTITASASGLSDSNTLTFTVVVGPLDHIVISPPTATVDPGVDQAYTVEAFDAADNSLGDVTSSSTMGITGGGTCDNTAHTCQAASVGAHTVTATHLTKTDTATLTINNVAPVAVADSEIFVNEDAAATSIDVIANDTEANGDFLALTITATTDGALGTVAIGGNQRFVTYTPSPNASGPDSFTYTISDGVLTSTATVTLSVVALNDAPTFTLGTDPTVLEDAGLQTVIGFAVGDGGAPDESAQTLTYVIDGDTNPGLFAALGEPAISPAGDLTFTPADETSGTATITVHVVDSGPNGGGDVNFSPTQTFLVTVTAVDDPPVAVDDGTITPYRVKGGVALVVDAAAGVLTNDTDVDTAANLLTAVLDTQGAHGTVALNADGSFTYTPSSNSFVGPDSFTYHANDGNGDSNIATVSIDIYLNHAPTAVSDVVTVVSGSGYVALNLLTNDNAANPDAPEIVHITAASHPVHGTVVKTGLETGGWTGLSYRPYSGYIGSDVFTYTISDGVFSSTASVLVKIPKDTYKPVATAPVQTITGQSIGTSTVKIRLVWTGTDKGYGIAKFELWSSVNGHSYTKIATTSGHSAYVTATVGKSYRFRVRAIDKKANIGAFAYGPKFTLYRYQETSSSIVYSSPWSTLSSSSYSGGHARSTTTAGFDATFTTLGRTLSWVAVRGPNRGTADVYVDGVLKAHVTLTSSTSTYRYVAYSITFTTSAAHSLQIVYTGPSTKRVDVDAFIFLR